MSLPNRLFLTGVPGSRWSGIAQTLETIPGFNTSDRTLKREYNHGEFSGHRGAYFGTLMELDPVLDADYIDSAWATKGGCQVVKSHDWAYRLNGVRERFPDDWIMLVYRPDQASYDWWHQAGGFDIKYPSYAAYGDSDSMMQEICKQNKAILEFAYQHNAEWNYFTTKWIYKNFLHEVTLDKEYPDILVTIIR